MDKIIFDYMLGAEKKRLDRWDVVHAPDTALREHDAPYYYISKDIRKQLGKEVLGGKLYAIRVTIEPVDISRRTLAASEFDAD